MNESPEGIIGRHAKVRLIEVASEPGPEWLSELILKRNGEPKVVLTNAARALRLAPEWSGVLGFDSFAQSTTATSAPPWEKGRNSFAPRPWTSHDDLLTAEWLQQHGVLVGHEVAHLAVELVAQEHTFHPIRDYLGALQWDGQPRTRRWLTSYLGADASPYVEAVGESFLVSAVARVQRPGCKADHMMVLEGGQGVGKSTTLQILGGPWFSDELGDVGGKDAAMQLRVAWILEMSELDAFGRREVTTIKAFLSRSTDRYRPPYGRRVIEAPRQSVFAGSTNADSYLRDETGGRRFWPVRVQRADLDALRRDRDQLWAEAVHLFRSNRTWWLNDPTLVREAQREQEARYTGDPWDEVIRNYVGDRSAITIHEVLGDALHIEKAKWAPAEQTRVARSLRTLGFERKQKREGGERQYEYRRKDVRDEER
jgi:predicted P-loop ATPase